MENFFKQFNGDKLLKRFRRISELTLLLTKFQNKFYVLQRPEADSFFFYVATFIVHLLTLRIQFVKKLYVHQDQKIVIDSIQEEVQFYQKSIENWPKRRQFERKHYNHFLGNKFVLFDLSPDPKDTFSIKIFDENYPLNYPDVIKCCQTDDCLCDFSLTKPQSQAIYREVNKTLIEIEQFLKLLNADGWFNDQCFDEFIRNGMRVLVGIKELRSECVNQYCEKRDAELIDRVLQEEIECLHQYLLRFDEERQSDRSSLVSIELFKN
jgi:hypothetical protein